MPTLPAVQLKASLPGGGGGGAARALAGPAMASDWLLLLTLPSPSSIEASMSEGARFGGHPR